MLKLLSIFTIFIYLFFLFEFVKCDCEINYNNDELSIKPTFSKTFGTRNFVIPHWEQKISLLENEQIFGYCATKFRSFIAGNAHYNNKEEIAELYHYQRYMRHFLGYNINRFPTEFELHENVSNVTLICQDNEIHVNDIPLKIEKFLCEDLSWGLYEEFEPYSWCKEEEISYVMQTKNLEENLVLSAACYDIKTRSLRSLLYTMGPNANNVDHNKLRFWATSVDLENNARKEVVNYKGVFPYLNLLNDDLLQTKLNSAAVENPFLQFVTYNYKPIVSEEPLMNYFKEYHLVLDTIWWKNLQLGNWKRFMNVMNQRAQNYTYFMYVGTSGDLEIPTQNNCEQKEQRSTINLQLNIFNKTIPKYIWNYVEATDGNDEFVFVGYNSPFEENDVIFCKDICSNIPWLKDIQTTFRYSVMGTSFCCSVDEIRAGSLLDGFPKQKFTSSLTKTVTTTTTTTTSEIPTDYPIDNDSNVNTIPTNAVEEDAYALYFDNE